jgi:hypothetical protein
MDAQISRPATTAGIVISGSPYAFVPLLEQECGAVFDHLQAASLSDA